MPDQYHHHKWPYSFSYFAASECNLACSHCYVEGGYPIPNKERAHLRERTVFLEKLRGIGYAHVIFVGGEATLNPHIIDDVAFVLELGLRPVIFSNGIAIPPALIDFAADHPPTSFVLSIYGREEAHDRFTRAAGAHARTMASLRTLCDRGIRVQVNAAVNRDNAESAYDLVHDLTAYPVDWVSLLYFSPFGWGTAIHQRHFGYAEWDRYLDRYRALKSFPVNVYAELMFMRRERYTELPAHLKKKTACNVVKGERICLDTAGNSFPCPMFAGPLQANFGFHSGEIAEPMDEDSAQQHAIARIRDDFKTWIGSDTVQSRSSDTFREKIFCPAHHRLLAGVDAPDLEQWTALCPFFQEHLAGPSIGSHEP